MQADRVRHSIIEWLFLDTEVLAIYFMENDKKDAQSHLNDEMPDPYEKLHTTSVPAAHVYMQSNRVALDTKGHD